jgi:hypothetical protein
MTVEQSTARAKRSLPFLIGALAVVALAVCAGAAVGGWFLARSQGWLPETRQEETDLQRMLASVPDRRDYRGEIWFGDRSRLMDAHDIPAIESPDDIQSLSDEEVDEWFRVSRNVWMSDFSGAQRAMLGWRDVFGYDWYQVDHEIVAGRPPQWFGVMEGTFDAEDIVAALEGLDYEEDEHEGTTYYSVRGDAEIDLEHEGSRLALANLNRIVVGEDRIIAAPATEILEQVLDAQADRRDSLADDPTYAALARAMGPVISAAILEGEPFHELSGSPMVAYMTPEARANLADELDLEDEPLHRYDLVGIGYLDDGEAQHIVIALAYDDPQDAEADAPVLADRLSGDVPSLVVPERVLSDYWKAGEPEVNSFEGGSTLAVTLELDDDAPPGLWLNMLVQLDLPFLIVEE